MDYQFRIESDNRNDRGGGAGEYLIAEHYRALAQRHGTELIAHSGTFGFKNPARFGEEVLGSITEDSIVEGGRIFATEQHEGGREVGCFRLDFTTPEDLFDDRLEGHHDHMRAELRFKSKHVERWGFADVMGHKAERSLDLGRILAEDLAREQHDVLKRNPSSFPCVGGEFIVLDNFARMFTIGASLWRSVLPHSVSAKGTWMIETLFAINREPVAMFRIYCPQGYDNQESGKFVRVNANGELL